MKSYINEHQLSQIITYISNQYTTYAVIKEDGAFVIQELKSSHFPIPTHKTANSFKDIIWPDGIKLCNNTDCHSGLGLAFDFHSGPEPVEWEIQNPDKALVQKKILKQVQDDKNKKIAFLGLTNCDALALNILLKELGDTDLLPKRENILIVSAECTSDEDCFCTALASKISGHDLYLQTEKSGYSVFSETKRGEQILKENGVTNTIRKPKIRQIVLKDRALIDKEKLKKAIADFALYQDFWQKIANNCFGCGSCTAVCPLCFCTKKEEKNQVDGSAKTCLEWDSCFAKSFSEIQNHLDLRPKRINRLYNWYHHKFVRAIDEKKHFLCTGCGRCINSCPAHLNQYKIIASITNQEEKIENE